MGGINCKYTVTMKVACLGTNKLLVASHPHLTKALNGNSVVKVCFLSSCRATHVDLVGVLSSVGMFYHFAGTLVVEDVPNYGDGAIVQLTHQCVLDQVLLVLVALSHHVTS